MTQYVQDSKQRIRTLDKKESSAFAQTQAEAYRVYKPERNSIDCESQMAEDELIAYKQRLHMICQAPLDEAGLNLYRAKYKQYFCIDSSYFQKIRKPVTSLLPLKQHS